MTSLRIVDARGVRLGVEPAWSQDMSRSHAEEAITECMVTEEALMGQGRVTIS
jgi:hypothetical protein